MSCLLTFTSRMLTQIVVINEVSDIIRVVFEAIVLGIVLAYILVDVLGG